MRISLSQRDLPKDERVSPGFLRQAVRTAARIGGLREEAELSLTLTHDARIQELNRTYRGKDTPTDVLSFALGDDSPKLPIARQLGDIVVSLETTYRHAHEYGTEPQAELAWVVCHGVLHLLGYDHQTEQELRRMRSLESDALRQLGLRREF